MRSDRTVGSKVMSVREKMVAKWLERVSAYSLSVDVRVPSGFLRDLLAGVAW